MWEERSTLEVFSNNPLKNRRTFQSMFQTDTDFVRDSVLKFGITVAQLFQPVVNDQELPFM